MLGFILSFSIYSLIVIILDTKWKCKLISIIDYVTYTIKNVLKKLDLFYYTQKIIKCI